MDNRNKQLEDLMNLPTEINLPTPESLNKPEGLTLPDPATVFWYKQLNHRTLYINQDIDENILEYTRMIIEFNREDQGKPIDERQPIKVFIFSYGGSLDVALHFISVCQVSQTPIYTYNMGVCASAAMLMLLAGHKRFSLPGAQCLLHEGSANFEGTADQVRQFQKEYERQLELTKSFIFSRTKISKKLYEKNKEKDWYMRDSELIELGVVDRIVDSIDELFTLARPIPEMI